MKRNLTEIMAITREPPPHLFPFVSKIPKNLAVMSKTRPEVAS